MSIVKKVCLKDPRLIRLKNGLRSVFYEKFYEIMASLRLPRRKLSELCDNIKAELEIEGRYKDLPPSDDIMGDLSKDMDYIINDLEEFIEDIKDSGLDAEELYIECWRKLIEVTRYEQALERVFQRSIITCGFPLCRDVSLTDMYLIPDLGVNHSWNRMWVCPEHYRYYQREIIFLYGVDVDDLTYPIKLRQKSPQELERMYDEGQ